LGKKLSVSHRSSDSPHPSPFSLSLLHFPTHGSGVNGHVRCDEKSHRVFRKLTLPLPYFRQSYPQGVARGGAVHIAASSESYNIAVTVEWSKFVRNTASSVLSCTGGAMYATGPAVTTRQSEFVASVCSSTRELARGGALFADYGTLALTGCRFANNYVNSSETGQQDRRNLSPSTPTPPPLAITDPVVGAPACPPDPKYRGFALPSGMYPRTPCCSIAA